MKKFMLSIPVGTAALICALLGLRASTTADSTTPFLILTSVVLTFAAGLLLEREIAVDAATKKNKDKTPD